MSPGASRVDQWAAGGAADVSPGASRVDQWAANVTAGAFPGPFSVVHPMRAQAGDNLVDAKIETPPVLLVHRVGSTPTRSCTSREGVVRRPDLRKQSSSPTSTALTTDDVLRFLVRPKTETVGSAAVWEVERR